MVRGHYIFKGLPCGRIKSKWGDVMSLPTTHQILYIQSSIINALRTKCGLTQDQITEIIDRADLLKFIEDNYELYHIEGIYNNLEDIQKYLKELGIKISIQYEANS